VIIPSRSLFDDVAPAHPQVELGLKVVTGKYLATPKYENYSKGHATSDDITKNPIWLKLERCVL
jgi:hypothetical protein